MLKYKNKQRAVAEVRGQFSIFESTPPKSQPERDGQRVSFVFSRGCFARGSVGIYGVMMCVMGQHCVIWSDFILRALIIAYKV